jgi:hypothetical protein
MTLDSLLARLQDNFRRVVDDDEARLYQREIGHVPLRLLDLAISHAIQTRKFFPNCFELLEDVASVRAANPELVPHFAPCNDCNDGWITVPAREQLVRRGFDAQGKQIIESRRGSPATARCACWFAWRRSHGLPVPTPRPTLQIDKDRAIGVDSNWSTPASSSNIAKFKARVAGGKK